ncbi:CD1375 family protein [Brevibacillus thermoruber]|nr:CD1375 family protein [Brevibacillus thermoruber]
MLIVASIYADLIREGDKTIDQVPESLRDEVQKLLDEDS